MIRTTWRERLLRIALTLLAWIVLVEAASIAGALR